MNKTEITGFSALVLMIMFLIMALVTKDVIMCKLLSSLGIFSAAFTVKALTEQDNSFIDYNSKK